MPSVTLTNVVKSNSAISQDTNETLSKGDGTLSTKQSNKILTPQNFACKTMPNSQQANNNQVDLNMANQEETSGEQPDKNQTTSNNQDEEEVINIEQKIKPSITKKIFEDLTELENRRKILGELRKTSKFKKFTDDQLLYFTNPAVLEQQKGMTIAQKIHEFFQNDISKNYNGEKFVNSTLIMIYKEFGIEQSAKRQYKAVTIKEPTTVPTTAATGKKKGRPRKVKPAEKEESDSEQ